MSALKCFYTDKPSGDFLAIYSDLSGATYFIQKDNGWTCDDFNGRIVDEHWFSDAGYLYFKDAAESLSAVIV